MSNGCDKNINVAENESTDSSCNTVASSEFKICSRCKNGKIISSNPSISEFYKKGRNRDGSDRWDKFCMECKKKKERDAYEDEKSSKSKVEPSNNRSLKRAVFNLADDEVEKPQEVHQGLKDELLAKPHLAHTIEIEDDKVRYQEIIDGKIFTLTECEYDQVLEIFILLDTWEQEARLVEAMKKKRSKRKGSQSYQLKRNVGSALNDPLNVLELTPDRMIGT